MNKNKLPILLVALAITAGAIAMAPVEPASAVHTTLQTTIGTIQVVSDTDAAWNAGDDLAWTCTGDSIVYAIGLDITGGAGLSGGENIDITVDTDGGTGDYPALTLEADVFGGATPADSEDLLFREVATDDTFKRVLLENGGTVVVQLQAEDTATSIENAIGTLFAVSDGTCAQT